MTQRVAAYEARILEEIRELQPVERRDQPVPKHPNAIKEKAIRRRGGHNVRTELWRFAGVDLTRIDGIGAEAALTLLTEAGLDLTAFPSEKHFVSWLRLAPKTAVSGGKPLPYKKRDGTGSTRVAVLRMAAISLKHSKTALGAAFRRKARHKGWSVAVFSMARRLAVLVYRMLVTARTIDIAEDLSKPASGNAASRASQMPLSLLAFNWFHKFRPAELRRLFQASLKSTSLCGSPMNTAG